MAIKDVHVGIVIFDDFTDIDLFLAWDLLHRLPGLLKRDHWKIHILGLNEQHTSKTGIAVRPTRPLKDSTVMDAVIITSGPGVPKFIANHEEFSQLYLDPKRQLIAGLCSGALILAAKGLLEGITATTYPTSVEKLSAYGIDVVAESFVRHGNIATAAACLAAQDVVAWMVSTLESQDAADWVIRSVQPITTSSMSLYGAP